MSLTLNMVGGGRLAVTDAILRVQTKARATVTISKGTITKTDLGHENADDPTVYDYYFIIHQSQFDSVNAWTVSATDGVDTETSTIIIDSADEYNVVLYFNYYIYKDGVFLFPFLLSRQSTNQTITEGESSITFAYSEVTDSGYSYGTTNKIDITKYRTLYVDLNIYYADTNYPVRIGVKPSVAINYNNYNSGFSAQFTPTRNVSGVQSLNITSVTGEARIVIDGTGTSGTISKIYLRE